MTVSAKLRLGEGQPYSLGSTFDGRGVNFALFSAHAEKVELCLFDSAGQHEVARLPLPEYTDEIWHGYLPDARPGLLYGYRVYGPYDPPNGHRFNANKLLIDPYARALDRAFEWNDIHCAYTFGDAREDLSFDARDNAAHMPKSRVVAPFPPSGSNSKKLCIPLSRSVIYELHVRGYTMRHPALVEAIRGTMAGLRHTSVIQHLYDLGITAVELMPIHPIATTRSLSLSGLRDYWGYNSINFFAIDPRYLANNDVDDFRQTVLAFHEAGIEVILDTVFNHAGEGDELGPTLSFRGIDNASYYCLAEDKRRYVDFTGCRNTLNFDHPRVLQMAMDSLRYWADDMQVDGFRFDLAVSLARESHHFSPRAKLLATIAQDPVLAKTKMIAEPWDLGPDGYKLGEFPSSWSEWNDRFRDGARKFWRGDDGRVSDLAFRLAGSSDVFGRGGRQPSASINYITAHDGFTLEDLVSYEVKHNQDNKGDSLGGTDANYSWNCGVEGPSDDPEVVILRERQKRNMMATLLLSQGIPMILAGDEFGRTQRGNNNAYCQDNELSWTDWTKRETKPSFLAFVQHLVAFRAKHSVFRKARFFHGQPIDGGDIKDIQWLRPDGREMTGEDWHLPQRHCLGARYAFLPEQHSESIADRSDHRAFLLLVNGAPEDARFTLPHIRSGAYWSCMLDTGMDEVTRVVRFHSEAAFTLKARSLALFSARD